MAHNAARRYGHPGQEIVALPTQNKRHGEYLVKIRRRPRVLML